MAPQYIIGIDGGGTKTCGRIEHIATGKCYEVKGGPSSLTNDFNGAVATISNVIQQLLDNMAVGRDDVALVIGVAGGGVTSQAEKLTHILSQDFASTLVCNDAKTSLFGANNGEPVTVVALGTGSVGARLDPDESEHYYGGWGFPIGDEGGGAKLGYHAVQLLLTELDQFHQPKSDLAINLFERFNNDRLILANWLRDATPVDYGELCPTVFAFEFSCEAARELILAHAKHCEALINTTRKDSNSPVVLLGGLAQITLPYLSAEISQYCQLSMGTALDGACLLAKKNAQNPPAKLPKLNKASNAPANIKQDFALLQQLNRMVSEERNPNTMQIDLMDTKQILKHINQEDKKVPDAVAECLEPMAQAVDFIVDAFQTGGRLIYIGAGTSGRLGILDAVECPPTFSVPPEQVVGLIAGGNGAIYKAVEGAEDNKELGQQDLIDINFGADDVLVGIAASGRTPYVIGALDYAQSLGARTVSLTCNPNSEMANHADVNICPVVGPEVLTGSTRMKSGTAQKLVLNMLTTASMIRIGKSYENLMVDVSASNKKLYMRAIRIVMQATNCDSHTAEDALIKTDFVVKSAILHILTGVAPEQCELVLAQNHGFLRRSVASLKD